MINLSVAKWSSLPRPLPPTDTHRHTLTPCSADPERSGENWDKAVFPHTLNHEDVALKTIWILTVQLPKLRSTVLRNFINNSPQAPTTSFCYLKNSVRSQQLAQKWGSSLGPLDATSHFLGWSPTWVSDGASCRCALWEAEEMLWQICLPHGRLG